MTEQEWVVKLEKSIPSEFLEIIKEYRNNIPVDIYGMCMECDIPIYAISMQTKVDGWIEYTEGDKFEIYINPKYHTLRKRYTLAHELSHFLLHKDKIIQNGNLDRGSVVVYKFCDVANGQNKAIYSVQNGFVGFELKDSTLSVFANNQGTSGVSPWSSSNDVSFDSNNPDVYTTYTTLYMWRENNTSARGQEWIQKYKNKTLTSQQNNAKQFTINTDGNIVEQGQSNPAYLFSYIDNVGHLYFRSASSANEYYGAVIKDNIFTWYSLKPGSYYPHPVWYNASDVIFDTSFPLVLTENFSIN